MDIKKLSWPIIEAIINQLQEAVFVIEGGMFIYVNSKMCDLSGYSEDELLLDKVYSLVHPDDRDLIQSRNEKRVAGEDIIKEYSFRIITKQGQTKTVRLQVDTLRINPSTNLSIGSMKDITETEQYKIDLEDSKKELINILNNLPDVFYRTDASGVVTYMSPSAKASLGYSPEEMYGRPLSDFYLNASEREKVVQALIDGKGKATQVEAWLQHKNGQPVWVSTNAYVRVDLEGNIIGVEGIARNITERKELEDKLAYLATHDPLTNLPTRMCVQDHLIQILQEANLNKTKVAILYSDLDGFKQVNDTYGHDAGDKVLIEVSKRLTDCIQQTDILGRLGGDEFLIILSDINSREDIERIGRKMLKTIEKPFDIPPYTASVTLSIGAALYPDDNLDAERLLSLADQALYESKRLGKKQIQYVS